jgi:hypothetical protein
MSEKSPYNDKARQQVKTLLKTWVAASDRRIKAKGDFDSRRLESDHLLLDIKSVADDASIAESIARKEYYSFVNRFLQDIASARKNNALNTEVNLLRIQKP